MGMVVVLIFDMSFSGCKVMVELGMAQYLKLGVLSTCAIIMAR
jgi:hypothetical protein